MGILNNLKAEKVLLALNILLLVGLLLYVRSIGESDKKAFVLNQKVFSSYKGTLLLEEKMKHLKQSHQQQLDSLSSLIQERQAPELIQAYEQKAQGYHLAEEELATRYTADVWKQINKHLFEFGNQQGYDFIFGASGDGNLMYARDAHDITDQVIIYINQKYEGD